MSDAAKVSEILRNRRRICQPQLRAGASCQAFTRTPIKALSPVKTRSQTLYGSGLAEPAAPSDMPFRTAHERAHKDGGRRHGPVLSVTVTYQEECSCGTSTIVKSPPEI